MCRKMFKLHIYSRITWKTDNYSYMDKTYRTLFPEISKLYNYTDVFLLYM